MTSTGMTGGVSLIEPKIIRYLGRHANRDPIIPSSNSRIRVHCDLNKTARVYDSRDQQWIPVRMATGMTASEVTPSSTYTQSLKPLLHLCVMQSLCDETAA